MKLKTIAALIVIAVAPVANAAHAFNRVSANPGALTPGTLSTVTLIATAVGILDVNWNTDSSSGFALHFFDLTSAPGTSVTIVPEPATAALFGLGLISLATRPGRRSG